MKNLLEIIETDTEKAIKESGQRLSKLIQDLETRVKEELAQLHDRTKQEILIVKTLLETNIQSSIPKEKEKEKEEEEFDELVFTPVSPPIREFVVAPIKRRLFEEEEDNSFIDDGDAEQVDDDYYERVHEEEEDDEDEGSKSINLSDHEEEDEADFIESSFDEDANNYDASLLVRSIEKLRHNPEYPLEKISIWGKKLVGYLQSIQHLQGKEIVEETFNQLRSHAIQKNSSFAWKQVKPRSVKCNFCGYKKSCTWLCFLGATSSIYDSRVALPCGACCQKFAKPIVEIYFFLYSRADLSNPVSVYNQMPTLMDNLSKGLDKKQTEIIERYEKNDKKREKRTYEPEEEEEEEEKEEEEEEKPVEKAAKSTRNRKKTQKLTL
jgi:hypothetical protein